MNDGWGLRRRVRQGDGRTAVRPYVLMVGAMVRRAQHQRILVSLVGGSGLGTEVDPIGWTGLSHN